MPPQSRHSLSSIIIIADEIHSALKSLSIGKATGPDSISNRLLKELAVPLSEPLADLLNFSIRSGKIPKLWKEANISPIYKEDDPSIVSYYRSISLLNTLGKVLEKNVHKYVFNFCRDKSIISTLVWVCPGRFHCESIDCHIQYVL